MFVFSAIPFRIMTPDEKVLDWQANLQANLDRHTRERISNMPKL